MFKFKNRYHFFRKAKFIQFIENKFSRYHHFRKTKFIQFIENTLKQKKFIISRLVHQTTTFEQVIQMFNFQIIYQIRTLFRTKIIYFRISIICENYTLFIVNV